MNGIGKRIGVAGLGRMGAAIAQRLVARGGQVTGWTRSGRAVEGVPPAPDLAALVAGSDVLVLSLFDDAAVAEVLDALAALDLSGRLIIETSTATPATLTGRAPVLAAAGAAAVDAPISGGPEMVLAGTCGVFIGGEDAAAARATPVMEAISGRVFHVGPLGAGLVMKVINNSMQQSYSTALGYMLPLAREAGLTLETVLRILSGGPAGLPSVRNRIPKILGEDDTVGFPARGTFKDNKVFRDVLASYGLSSPILELYAAREDEIRAAGLIDRDVAAMIRYAYNRRGD